MKKKHKLKKEEIHWNDAYHLNETWLSVEEVIEKYKEGDYKIVNIGWILFEDKKYVIMTAKRDIRYDTHGFVMMIPKGMITKRIKL